MPRRNQPPSATRGMLGHEDRGQAQLPSGGQPLGRPQGHEEHTCAHADPGLPREQADRRGGAAHYQDHRRQQALAPSDVAEASDEDCAERPSEERRGVDGECGEQEIRTLLRGEEDLHQHDPKRTEDGEVVPLDDVSDAGGDRGRDETRPAWPRRSFGRARRAQQRPACSTEGGASDVVMHASPRGQRSRPEPIAGRCNHGLEAAAGRGGFRHAGNLDRARLHPCWLASS